MDFVRSPRSASTFFSQVSFEWGLVISGFWTEAIESVGCPELATWLVSRSACWEMHSVKKTEWPVVEDVTLSFHCSVFLVCFGYSCALRYCPLHYCLVNYWSFSFCFQLPLLNKMTTAYLPHSQLRFLCDLWLWEIQIKLCPWVLKQLRAENTVFILI